MMKRKRTKMTTLNKVAVLLPTLNEEQAIGQTIDRIKTVLPDADIIVIDGLSTDKTIEIAEQKGAIIMRCMERGKGKAIRMALSAIEMDRICLLDADGSYPPESLPAMLEMLKDYDVVVGNREDTATSMSFIHAIGNRLLTVFANFLFDKCNPDLCSGMWVMKKTFYKNIEIKSDGFALEANFYTEAVKKNMEFGSFSIKYTKRLGQSKLQWYHGFDIVYFLIRERFR